MQIIRLSYIKTLLKRSPAGIVDLLFSSFFTFATASGYILSTHENIDVLRLNNGLIVAYLCGALVIWIIITLALMAVREKVARRKKPGSPQSLFLEDFSDKKLWLTSTFAIFACYLPLTLLCNSVLTPDSWNSVRQITGDLPLNNAHPIIFTAFAGIFLKIGMIFGNLSLGIILFSLVQSALMAMIFALVIVWMRNQNIGKNFIIATFLFYAVLPVNSIAGIIMWKDILFAGIGLLFLLMLRKLYIEKGGFFTKRNVAIYTLLAFLFCVWRSNGIYAYALFSVLILIIERGTFLNVKYISLILSPVALFITYSSAISMLTGPTPSTVALTVPLQQIARTVKYHGSSISEKDQAIINEILPYQKIGSVYNPNLADPVLWTFDNKAFKQDKQRYIKLWLELFIKYKKTYVAAFLYNTYGYIYPLFPSNSPTDILFDNSSHLNALKSYSDEAYLNGNKPAVTSYQMLITSTAPFLRNIGLYSLVIVLGLYIAVIKRKRELTGVFIILFCLFASTILGPVNGELRYLYLFVVATPVILASAYYPHSNGKVA